MAEPEGLTALPWTGSHETSRVSRHTNGASFIVEKKIQYLISVGNKCYQIVRPLSEFKADGIQGHATRVWEVLEVVNGKSGQDSHVLKDFWLELDATPGKDLCETLQNEAENDGADKALFEYHFLKFLHGASSCQDVSTKRFMRNHDLKIIHSDKILPPGPEVRSRTRHLHTSTTHPTSIDNEAITLPSHHLDSELAERPPANGAKRYNPRSHQRSVYCVYTTYHDLADVSIMYRALRDCVKTLQLLWKLNYIHRDVSTGNIFWNHVKKVGRLADIEFMKKMSDTAVHDVKTGTAEFMAVGVHLQEYLFRPPGPVLDRTALYAALRSREPKVEFRFNPLHDLESIWWIALWTFLHFIPADVSGGQLLTQYHIARMLFPGIAVDASRNGCFRYPEQFRTHLDKLDFNAETVMGELGLGVDVLAFALRQEYMRVEKEFPIQAKEFDGVHDLFNDVMEHLVTSSSEQGHNLVPLRNMINEKCAVKRKSRDDDTKAVEIEAPRQKKSCQTNPPGR